MSASAARPTVLRAQSLQMAAVAVFALGSWALADERGTQPGPSFSQAVLATSSGSATSLGPRRLFLDAAGEVAGPSADGAVLRSREAALDMEAFATDELLGRRLALNLFEDADYEGEVTLVRKLPSGSTMAGRLMNIDPPGWFVVVVDGDRVSGTIGAPGKGIYVVRRSVAGGAAIRELKPRTSNSCDCGAQVSRPEPAPEAVTAALNYCEGEGSTMDLVVLYSTAARQGAQAMGEDMNHLIMEGEAFTNLAYQNSGIDARVRVVYTTEVTYDETRNYSSGDFINANDGQLDEVHALRDEYQADLAMLILESSDYHGWGGLMQEAWPEWSSHSKAFSMVRLDSLVGMSTFAHEIGHNLGVMHTHSDPCEGENQPLYEYSYGHAFNGASGQWHTIMAYNPGVRIAHFSNPQILYDGAPTGVLIGAPGQADAAATMNFTSRIVATYRCSSNQDCNGNGVGDAQDISSGLSSDSDQNGLPDECGVRLYVQASAPAGGDCRSWSAACNDLQKAMDEAAFPWSRVTEVWVAAGVYKPDRGTGDRTMSFRPLSGVAVYGGFRGDEGALAERAGLFEHTVLSGDLAGDDAPDFGNREDNSYHVVRSHYVDRTAIIDGFAITGGHANGAANYSFAQGGGILNNGSPTLRNLLVARNFAANEGGGMSQSFNSANGGPATISKCTFRDNVAVNRGGGLTIFGGAAPPVVTSCAFYSNTANEGGGVYATNGSVALTDCIFAGNSAQRGGGIRAYISTTLTNCIFSGNLAAVSGGAIDQYGPATITNCTFAGNSGGIGGAFYFDGSYVRRIVNSILWNNSAANTAPDIRVAGSLTISSSCVNSLASLPVSAVGPGNTSVDPGLLNPAGPDGNAGTDDDDLGLSTNSPIIDAGDNKWISNNSDFSGLPRFVDGNNAEEAPGIWATVDMGAREMALTLRHLPADDLQTSCDACAVRDCSACSTGSCNDGQASLCETIAYACAWKNGCNDDLAGMTRSAYIWHSGECYCWEYWDSTWYSSACQSQANLFCNSGNQGANAASVDLPLASRGTATLVAKASSDGDLNFTLSIIPQSGVRAVAAELPLPEGWEVLALDQGGQFDPLHRKMKFGPFFDGQTRTLTAAVRPIGEKPIERRSGLAKDSLSRLSLKRWVAAVSFDGENQEIRAQK